jgi:hypothetical protein
MPAYFSPKYTTLPAVLLYAQYLQAAFIIQGGAEKPDDFAIQL